MEGTNNFTERYVIVLLIVPLILLLPLGLLIVFLSSSSGENVTSGELNFPFNYILGLFGEGSVGSFYIIVVIFSFYIGAKLFDPKIQSILRIIELRNFIEKKRNYGSSTNKLSESNPSSFKTNNTYISIRFKDYIIFALELITAFVSISAAFSLSGVIINDGTPPLEKISRGFLFFSFLTVIPFIVLITRNLIFNFQKTEEQFEVIQI